MKQSSCAISCASEDGKPSREYRLDIFFELRENVSRRNQNGASQRHLRSWCEEINSVFHWCRGILHKHNCIVIMICLNFDMYRSGSYFRIDIHVIRKFLFIAHVNILGPGRLSTVYRGLSERQFLHSSTGESNTSCWVFHKQMVESFQTLAQYWKPIQNLGTKIWHHLKNNILSMVMLKLWANLSPSYVKSWLNVKLFIISCCLAVQEVLCSPAVEGHKPG